MRVKGKHMLGFIASIALLAGCSSAKKNAESELAYTGVWQQQPLVVDGDDEDWVKPLPYKDKDVACRISNDSDYLYIQLSAQDAYIQQRILQAGLTIWINNAAEKTEKNAAGIACPTGNNHSARTTGPISTNSAGGRAIAQSNIKDYMLFGFSDEGVDNYNYGDSNRAGVQVKIDFNEAGELIYEASVPLRSLYPKTTLHRYAGRNLAVGIVIEALPSQDGGNGGSGVSVGGGIGVGSYGSGAGIGISLSPAAFGGGKKYKPTKKWQVIPIARAPRK